MIYEVNVVPDDTAWQHLFEQLWQFTQSVARWTNTFWEWINTPLTLSFRVTLFSFSLQLPITWLSIFVSGTIITLMVMSLVKMFVPFA